MKKYKNYEKLWKILKNYRNFKNLIIIKLNFVHPGKGVDNPSDLGPINSVQLIDAFHCEWRFSFIFDVHHVLSRCTYLNMERYRKIKFKFKLLTIWQSKMGFLSIHPSISLWSLLFVVGSMCKARFWSTKKLAKCDPHLAKLNLTIFEAYHRLVILSR